MKEAEKIISQFSAAKKDLKLSLEALGGLTGMSKQYIGQILRSNNLPLQTACILAKALNCELKLVKKDEKEKV